MENEIKYSKTLSDFLNQDKSQYPDTLIEVLEYSAKRFGDRPAVGKALEHPITYSEFLNKVISISELLVDRGVMKGDRIAILGENSPHWGIAYFAAVRAGAAAVPILPDFPEADIRHILSDSEAKILFTTLKQLEKLGDLESTKVKSIIMMDDIETDTQKISEINKEFLSDIFEKAIDFIKKIPGNIGLVSRKASENDTVSIIYTSGTSGHSKAVMLSHRNLISNVVAVKMLVEVIPGDTFLSVLPLSHTYEFSLGFLLPLFSGARIVYLDKAPTPSVLEKVCKVEKPTTICSVPLILEKIYKKKVAPVLGKNLAIKLITKIPGLKKKIYKKINHKLLDFFGGQLRVMSVGGASFNQEAEKFFNAAGFPYIVGYGLTETAPLLAGGPVGDKTIKITSTGKPTPGCELKIVNPDPKTGIGEIFARGPNIMKGYYKNPELTAEVLDKDGWFKTGDLGHFDKYNNLYIKGRSKNMILLANGENIYPEAVEEKLNACPQVMESLVTENNDQLEAWVYLDYDLVDAETHGKTERQRLEFIEKVLADTRECVNTQLSSFSKLARIYEQKEPFVKTATHKIKRYLYAHPHTKKNRGQALVDTDD
ncbi:MAG: AMP-binding protein [Candidatus Aminicenantes bacterium]|nr:AMP-binding protein [Candidatus Aminicenantes bacterium]